MNDQEKKPVIVVIQTKGGVGKSAISQEVISTYLLAKYGKARLVELDDQNHDSHWMSASMIETSTVTLGDADDEYAMAISEAIKLTTDAVTIDVGGNRTAEIFIESLNNLSARLSHVDAFCIPISDNRISVKNAEKTLSLIKSQKNGANMLKRCFIALNRVRLNSKSSSTDRYIQTRFNNVVNLVKKWDLPMLVVHDFDGIENKADLGLTVYEIERDGEKINEELTNLIYDAAKQGDKDKEAATDNLQWAVNQSISKFYPSIIKSHEQLDDIMNAITAKMAG